MAPLDSDFGNIDPSSVPYIPTAVRVGLIGGLVMIVYALIGNIIGFTKPSAGFFVMIVTGLVSLVIYIAMIVYGVKIHRDRELGGFITFGRALLLGTIIAFVASFLGTIFNYVYINFIDPEHLPTLIAEMEEMFDNMGMPEEQIEEALQGIRDSSDPIKMFTQGLLWATAIGAVVSAIIGAIMKKNPENA